MNISNIKTVVYDLDDTLYDFLSIHPYAYEVMLQKVEKLLPVSREEFIRVYEPTYQQYVDSIGHGIAFGAAHSRMLRLGRTLERLHLPLFPNTLELYNAYWDKVLDMMTPRPGIREAMERLKTRGIRVGLGTNMTVMMQYRKIEKLGLGPFIDFMVTSEEPIYDKPDPRFFDMVAEKAECPRETILFIGDNKGHDYLPAREAGMTSLWYRPDLRLSIGNEEENDQIIHHHLEIFGKEWE